MEQNQNSDFSKLFNAQGKLRTKIRIGEKLSGRVFMIGKDTVFVDIGARSDGVLDKLDFVDDKGACQIAVGDTIEAFCMGWGSEGVKLQMKMSRDAADSSIADAYRAGMPVEGKISEERKGGFTVQIANLEAFCPYSQIAGRGSKKENAEYVGTQMSFLITEYSEEGRNIVLSRRRLLEAEAAKNRERLIETLQEGDIVDGIVVKIMPFGAFVDLGGVEGMVHVSEISWQRGVAVEEMLHEGQSLQVKILSLDWGNSENKERLALSIKQAEADPWEMLPGKADYALGSKRQGKVTRITDFGVFIELEPGLEGLAHISQLGSQTQVAHPSEVVSEGEQVEVTILDLDSARRRISLCLGDPKHPEETAAILSQDEEKQLVAANVAGQTLEGEVENLKPFGIFVKLPNGQTGLLHISQIALPEGERALATRALYRNYPLHSKLSVVVREVDGDRISLTLPETLAREQELERNEPLDVKDAATADFGSLDSLFGDLKL